MSIVVCMLVYEEDINVVGMSVHVKDILVGTCLAV